MPGPSCPLRRLCGPCCRPTRPRSARTPVRQPGRAARPATNCGHEMSALLTERPPGPVTTASPSADELTAVLARIRARCRPDLAVTSAQRLEALLGVRRPAGPTCGRHAPGPPAGWASAVRPSSRRRIARKRRRAGRPRRSGRGGRSAVLRRRGADLPGPQPGHRAPAARRPRRPIAAAGRRSDGRAGAARGSAVRRTRRSTWSPRICCARPDWYWRRRRPRSRLWSRAWASWRWAAGCRVTSRSGWDRCDLARGPRGGLSNSWGVVQGDPGRCRQRGHALERGEGVVDVRCLRTGAAGRGADVGRGALSRRVAAVSRRAWARDLAAQRRPQSQQMIAPSHPGARGWGDRAAGLAGAAGAATLLLTSAGLIALGPVGAAVAVGGLVVASAWQLGNLVYDHRKEIGDGLATAWHGIERGGGLRCRPCGSWAVRRCARHRGGRQRGAGHPGGRREHGDARARGCRRCTDRRGCGVRAGTPAWDWARMR